MTTEEERGRNGVKEISPIPFDHSRNNIQIHFTSFWCSQKRIIMKTTFYQLLPRCCCSSVSSIPWLLRQYWLNDTIHSILWDPHSTHHLPSPLQLVLWCLAIYQFKTFFRRFISNLIIIFLFFVRIYIQGGAGTAPAMSVPSRLSIPISLCVCGSTPHMILIPFVLFTPKFFEYKQKSYITLFLIVLNCNWSGLRNYTIPKYLACGKKLHYWFLSIIFRVWGCVIVYREWEMKTSRMWGGAECH